MKMLLKILLKQKNSDNDGKLGTILEKKLETTSIVSNDGTFRYSDVTKVDSIYYTVGTNSISSALHEYDGKDVITSYLSNANIKYIATGVNFVLPSNIINVDSYSFYFDENNLPTLSTSLEESQLLEVFKANATNAIIEIEKDEVVNQYKFENGVLKNITSNVVVGTPSYSNPVEAGDFTIKCLEDNNGKVKQLDKLYVAYDQKTFNLEAEFIDDSVSSQEVLWSSQNSELVSIDLEGKATIESLPEVGSTYEVTLRATALAGGHYEEITVFIVRPTQGNITLGETYTLLVNNLELGNTIDINYDGSVSTFDFTDLYLSYNINDVVSVDTNYEITTNGDLFEIVGNSEDGYSLNLREFDGTQNFTIKVGDYLEKEFVVNVIDNSSSPFELKFKNTDKYMYRIVGIFKDSAGNNHLKLIKKEALNTKYAWHTSNTSDVNWGASSLYTNLHGDYFMTNTAYPYMQNTAWTSMITNWTWSAVNTLTNSNSGTSYYNTLTASQIYYHEMNSSNKSVTAGAWTTPTGKIGIMYVSDFMLSLGESSLNLTGYSNRTTLLSGWMHLTNNDSATLSTTAVAPPSSYEWTMARYGTTGSNYTAWFLRSAGFPNFTSTAGTYSIRPVFYLNSDVQYFGGTGTSTDPYIIYTNADTQTSSTYSVTVASSNNNYGTIAESAQTVSHGNSVSFTLSPSSGYVYKSNTCGGTVSGNTLTISNVTGNISCTVNFGTSLVVTQYTVSVSSNNTSYGRVSPASQTVLSR